MKTVFIDKLTYTFTPGDVLERMGMPRDHNFGDTIAQVMAQAEPIAKPKAFFMEVPIEDRTENTVTLAGETFHSTALVKNFAGLDTVYPYLCTCGQELADYADSLTDIMGQYAFDAIMEFYLRSASLAMTEALANYLEEDGLTSSVNPGSLVDWSIEEQTGMFRIFGANAEQAGVKLSESCLMFPVKSVSGIRYRTKKEFKNCQLCQRANCPTREADFDQEFFLKTLNT